MKYFTSLLRRDSSSEESPAAMNSTVITLLVILLVLFALTLILVGTLLIFRHKKRSSRKQNLGLPLYNEKSSRPTSSSSTMSHHRRVMVRPSESVHIYHEKQHLMNSSDGSSGPASPSSPLPEIRITFPEEIDEATGKRVSGRMVMVHVGETGVGLEPVVSGEALPGYLEKEPGDQNGSRFHSVDLDRVGGLIEKEDKRAWK
ncbi:hypothetical protein K431DRAFT_59674 [Polychaeton citri CBS 116435]|uniref:Uncharacterized protein n=1 Tax=Polychaeton citri CBS 116435 TaxID=1314669 RepID=A0A9P4Q7J4_9PEZI|nr:hypothetical protein K431DRAFT_59674 [Polychaeton citri CBS 116435]